MSAVSSVLNKSTLKVIAALAIPATIAYFFWYAQQQANIEVAQYKQEQAAHPTKEELEVNNYEMKEVDDANRLRWQLKSDSGKMLANGQDVELRNVTVQYFDPTTKALKMKMVAPIGHANQSTKYVKLSADRSTKVIAEGEGGKNKLVCNEVELTKKNQFIATGGVIIEWPGVAKVSGNSATGSINMGAGPKDFKVVGNTHAEIAVK
jgi:hypothetical protein